MGFTKKHLFLITFFLTIFARCFTWYETTSIPFTFMYVAFIVFWSFMLIFDNSKELINIKRPAGFIIIMLFLYSVIWGLYNIKDLDRTDTLNVMFRSILMLLFVFISSFWIKRLNCLHNAICVGYFAFASLMILSFLLHINEIDLKRTFLTYWESSESVRYRVLFGFGFNNIAAEYSMSTILLSIYMIGHISEKKPNRRLKIFIYLLIDLLMLIIILSNNSRGTLIALFVVLFLWLFTKINKRTTLKVLFRRLLVVVGIAAVAGIVLLSYKNLTIINVLEKMNRTHFLDNIEAMRRGNKWLMGLGKISGAYFSERNVLYGVKLNYMEMYYVDVFVTSGIIGCIWSIVIIFIIIQSILIQKRSKLSEWLLIALGYMLFLSFFEGYLFSFSYITSTFFLVILVSYISIKRPCFEKTKHYKIVKVVDGKEQITYAKRVS